MLTTKAYELETMYKFEVTDGTHSFEYNFSKDVPEEQTVTEFLQNCKREVEALTQLELDKLTPPEEIQL